VIWRNDGLKGAYGGRSAEREFFGDGGWKPHKIGQGIKGETCNFAKGAKSWCQRMAVRRLDLVA